SAVAEPSSSLGSVDASVSPPEQSALADTHTREHDSLLTWANHVDLANPMTPERLATVLRTANVRAGREDFAGDVACCATVSASATPRNVRNHSDGPHN